ncbi:esterase [Novosphingobium fuchskuhlense]|uniref:Esterase n=1 Tax=Novosphingobium fuchskuhlense TaxID=1117702 RepID=A0A124JVD0_9SPHN|nr:alpha/beta hydrolase [Novosphingobium fuchskuhlense]KUR72155.1 esterase [Novosphingobium fuchskuhlense]
MADVSILPGAPRKPRRRWLRWVLAVLAVLCVGGYLMYRQALATEAVALLDTADRMLRGGDGSIREVAAVRYGSDPAQKLEMFLPADAIPVSATRTNPLPIIVFIHGGGWRSGDPHDYRFMARALAPQGYAVVLAGYRLYPKAQYPGMLEDGAAALRWVADHARGLGGDPDRVVLVGHSAGAYNAVMLGLDQRWLAAKGLSATALRGVVGLAGPYDFYPFENEATKLSFGRAPNPEETQPVVHARAGGPPLLLVHGTADTRVRPRNSVELARTMSRAGAPTRAVLLDGVTHEGLIMMFARPFSHDPRALDAVLPFLARVTASPPVQAHGG